ncbi:penicillin-binding protein [Nostocoides sp. F2B08]|uniref:transglycosylase domain-containing protein n=1 Tax=Nostocoides sp. F2B08 TaxID=2653936 RepID=UPI0012634B90|nr:transglycosylase domain-containing protein [Tetrasphaera sp. F2B08]KAB7745513.1 penicillin-binding protein [Tetrasphaera sp. F2B08]
MSARSSRSAASASRTPKNSAKSSPSSRADARADRRKKRPRWGRAILITILSLGVLGLVGLGMAYAMTDIPEPNDAALAEASVIYYADGETELDRLSEINRDSVSIDEVPEHVRNAVLAAEDRTFYENDGISVRGLGRAVVGLVTGDSTSGGGSTITQQYVRNYFLTQERSYVRKAKEILISVKIDGELSKDEILENYLNTIYFGRGASGIQTASQAYFGKDVSELTVEEGALLAAIIQQPSYLDPAVGTENAAAAKVRWDYVMDGMVSQGWLDEADRAAADFPTVAPSEQYRGAPGPLGYITDEVKRELTGSLGLTDAQIETGGLRIVTTIEKQQQDAIVAAVDEWMPTGEGTENLQVGAMSVVPGDGAITMMYGGRDFQERQFNNATQATMQAGSTWKPFTLMGALEEGISTRSTFNGNSPAFFEEFESVGNEEGRVKNFGDVSYGRVDLRQATENSVNTAYAELNLEIGPEKTTESAVKAGVPEEGLENNPANVLGTATVRVADMAKAYATFAAEGERSDTYLIRSITSTVEGSDIDYEAQPRAERAFDADQVSDLIDAMTRVTESGSGRYAGENLDRPSAGKTGTSESFRSAWFNGFVPQLETAVGMFQDENGTPVAMTDIPGYEGGITGGTIPVRIWTDYMVAALDGTEVIPFPEPADTGESNVPTRTQAPPPPPPATTQEPQPEPTTETPTEEPTTETPTEEPEPTQTPEPTQEPQPTPTPPAPTPTETGGPPDGSGGGGGNPPGGGRPGGGSGGGGGGGDSGDG